MENTSYSETQIQLDKNEAIFVFTDGIPDAHNAKSDLYSIQKLENLLQQHTFSTPENLVKSVIDSTQDFEKGQEQFDDITALCVYYK